LLAGRARFDNATGWGTFDGTALVPALATGFGRRAFKTSTPASP
jgi:hypothetical protein